MFPFNTSQNKLNRIIWKRKKVEERKQEANSYFEIMGA